MASEQFEAILAGATYVRETGRGTARIWYNGIDFVFDFEPRPNISRYYPRRRCFYGRNSYGQLIRFVNSYAGNPPTARSFLIGL